jgi:prevent-host-death family protein
MKFVGVREAQQGLSGLVEDCQTQGIVLTRHGKPVAVLLGVEGHDPEEILLAHDPAFRALIAARRQSARPLVTHETLLSRAREALETYRTTPAPPRPAHRPPRPSRRPPRPRRPPRGR